jgi:hypothetical protein
MVHRPIQIRIPVDLSRAVDGSPAALLRWQGLSRAEREILAWYVDKTWTLRDHSAQVLQEDVRGHYRNSPEHRFLTSPEDNA